MSDVMVCVQARMGSTRLPGKTLLPIGPLTALEHTVERVKLVGYKYVLTIPELQEDNPLYSFCLDHGYPVQRGPHPDVLSAMTNACAAAGGADYVVRITADCPFIQPEEIQAAVARVLHERRTPVYYSNAHPTRVVPKGLDFEIFDWDLMQLACGSALDSADRHHVTPWMRRHLGLATSTDDGAFRVTLDTPEDYARLQRIATALDVTPPHPTVGELAAFFYSSAPTKTSSSASSR